MATSTLKAKPTWYSTEGVFTLAYQIVISFLLQIPLLYYVRIIRNLETKDTQTFLLAFIPINVVLLLLAQFYITEYYWQNEKIRKHRQIFKIGSKASLWVTIMTLIFYYWFTLYLLPKADIVTKYLPDSPLETIAILSLFGIFLVLLLAMFLLRAYEERMVEKLAKRMSRGRRKK